MVGGLAVVEQTTAEAIAFRLEWTPAVVVATCFIIPGTPATNLRAGGMEEADVMKITGHTTPHVFRHYDIGHVESFRSRVANAR